MCESDAPRFLSLDQIMDLHARGLAMFGGQAGLREPGLAEGLHRAMIAVANHELDKRGLAELFSRKHMGPRKTSETASPYSS